MTTGTIVGIAVGAGLALLGAIALFIVYFRRQKRYEREESLLPDFYDKPPRSGTSSITATNSGIGPHFSNDYKSEPPSYELKEQQVPQHIVSHFNNNADYYDEMEGKGRSRVLSQQVLDMSNGKHTSNSALPTHPAYVPRGYIGGRPSRNSSPNQQPRPKSNKPDSYAIQAYLNAAEDSRAPPPPINLPPPQPTLSNQPPVSRAAQAARQLAPEPKPAPAPAPPPPPPTKKPTAKVPSLVLPSVPRIRVPKKYSPPQIQVQEATPVDRQAINDITGPLAYPDERFSLRFDNPDDRVIEHNITQPQSSPAPIGSGKSYLLYG